MKTKRTFIIPALAMLLVMGLTVPALAHEGSDDTVVSNEIETETEVTTGTDDSTISIKADDDKQTRLQRQAERIKERRAAIEAKLAERRAEHKERLEGRRLATCENREQRINQLLDRSAENGKRHLQVIQRIEEGIKKFYRDKALSADGYDAALAAADEREADAVAALDVLSDVDFDCANADGQKPAAVIASAVHQRHDALKAYRTTVKDLLLVVKKSLNDKAGTSTDEATKQDEEV